MSILKDTQVQQQTDKLLQQLRLQHKLLAQDVLKHDARLPKADQRLLQDIERFNSELFIQQGAKLTPCLEQAKKSINQLNKLLTTHASAAIINASCERIMDQFSAIRRALKTTDLNLKSAQQLKATKIAMAKKRRKKEHDASGFSWIAANVMQSSHKLYEELTKHQNWVTKFEQKIEYLQSELENCHYLENSRDSKNKTTNQVGRELKIKKQNEILNLHRRLGQCRKAISYIEERIQLLERPNSRTKR